ATFALGALVAATAFLVPQSEVRLFLFGNVSIKTIAIIYISLELIFLALADKAAALAFLTASVWGIIYMSNLKQGRDFSKVFKRLKRSKLKVVHTGTSAYRRNVYRNEAGLPNQVEIDEILDKISVGGYESLSSQEKEVLFKASKSDR